MRTFWLLVLLCVALLVVGCSATSPQMAPPTPVSTTGATGTGSSTTVSPALIPIGSLTTARANHTATLLPNGKVLIAGGDGNGSQPLASAELFDPSTGMFTPTGNMTTVRTWGQSATLLANGKVLISGGSDKRDTYEPLASAELYDPSTGMFTPTGNMITVQRAGPATLLADGRAFVPGDSDAEIYDPAAGTFSQTGAYVDPTPVLWGSATLLLDGRVLLTGCASQCTVGATELFDPKTGTFSRTGPMKDWGDVNTATLLTNGKVLLVGNAENDGSPADAEVYDPAAGTFTFLGTTSAPHEFAAAVRYPDGSVLIAGGQLPGGNGSVGTDIYLPSTGTFVSGGNMATARHSHTATLLSDGLNVLIVGGYSAWPTPTASAEIYNPTCVGCWDY
jgi:large repetitive protein